MKKGLVSAGVQAHYVLQKQPNWSEKKLKPQLSYLVSITIKRLLIFVLLFLALTPAALYLFQSTK